MLGYCLAGVSLFPIMQSPECITNDIVYDPLGFKRVKS